MIDVVWSRAWSAVLILTLWSLIGVGIYAVMIVNLSPVVPTPTTRATTISTNEERTSPPEIKPFNKTGVILFHHLAKTGGSTIRENFNGLDNVQFVRAMDREDFASISRVIEAILSGNLTKILFIEMHGGADSHSYLPGLVELHPQMKHWRRLSGERQVPFFAFTLLREPISLHVSAFLFFHLKPCGAPWCSKVRFKPREEYIVASAAPNRQCMALARGQQHQDAWRNTTNVTVEECEEVFNLLMKDLDWVGTTDSLSETTLPMLFEMLNRKELALNAASSKVNNSSESKQLKAQNLTIETRKALEVMSVLDMKLYDEIRSGRRKRVTRPQLSRS